MSDRHDISRPLVLAAALLFFQLFSAYAAGPSSGDAYVTGTIADAVSLIPFLHTDSASASITELVFNGLTKVDKDLKLVGDLAQKWEVSDDGMRIAFFLKKDARWHDGTPVTSEDVKFTFEAILDPANGCPYASSYKDIEKIELVDEHTVVFYYSRPYAPALSKLGISIVPGHILRGQDIRKSAFKRAPVGSGPYVFKTWKTDQHLILEAYERYFEHRPYIDRYVSRVIPDQAVQFLELKTGGIDTMALTSHQYFYRTQDEKFKKDFDKYVYPSHSYTFIGYNLLDPLFQDAAVRRALSHAVDRQEIIAGVLMGLGEPCTGPFFSRTPYYSRNAEQYAYDPEKAKGLLAEAGWRDTDGDGILDKDGRPFAFKIITNQGNKEREDIAAIVQRKWRQLGIDAEVQTIAWAAFINEFIDKKNFQAVILGWTLPLDPDCHTVWHSESSGKGGLNFISYKNKEVDNLIIEGIRTFDDEKRIRIYNRIHELIAQDAPYTFLYFPYSRVAVSRRFKGIEPAPAGIGYNFIDWYVEPGDRRY